MWSGRSRSTSPGREKASAPRSTEGEIPWLYPSSCKCTHGGWWSYQQTETQAPWPHETLLEPMSWAPFLLFFCCACSSFHIHLCLPMLLCCAKTEGSVRMLFSRVCSNFDCLMWSTVYCLWSSTTHRLRLSTIIHGWIFAIRKTVLHSFLTFLGLCRRWRHPNYVNASIPKDQLNHISVYLFLYFSVSLRSPPCNFCNHVWLVAKL